MTDARLHMTGLLRKGLWIVGYFAIWTWLYEVTNLRATLPGMAHQYVSPIEATPWLFQPRMAVVYVFGGWATLVIPFVVHWRGDGVRRVVTSMAIASGISLVIYFVWPVIIVRPNYDLPGLGPLLMRWVVSVDRAGNTFPSGHTFFAVLSALWVDRSEVRLVWKIGAWCLAVAIALSTILVGQHYYWDVAGGVCVAWFGYRVAIKVPRARFEAARLFE